MAGSTPHAGPRARTRADQSAAATPAEGRRGANVVTIDAEGAGQRIDNFLLTRLKGVPRSRIYRCIRGGEVRVNGGRIKQTYRLAEGDVVRVPPVGGPPREAPQVSANSIEMLRGRVLYEDPWLLVLDKPSGMAVHGGSGISLGLIECLRADPERRGDVELVHRLDRETSGCLLVARRRSALRALHEALRQHEVTKHYLALVHGKVRRAFTANDALRRSHDSSGERVVRAGDGGKASSTHFAQVSLLGPGKALGPNGATGREGAAGATFTLVRATPKTGRTHQVRVHAAAAEHPLAGDSKYASREHLREAGALGLKRLFLHAERLEFAHPEDGRRMRIEAPLAPELRKVLDTAGIRPRPVS